jgi:hypothetical protein
MFPAPTQGVIGNEAFGARLLSLSACEPNTVFKA